MESASPNGTGRYLKYAIIVLVAILLILGFFLVREYRTLRREQIIDLHALHLSAILTHHGSLTANDVDAIRPWMTFDYVNKLFNIPGDYLKTHFGITDARYPQLSLAGYARGTRSDIPAFTNNVIGVVYDYLTAKSN